MAATDPLLAAPLMTRFPVSPLVLKVWNATPLAPYVSLPTGDALFSIAGPIQAHFGWNNKLLPTISQSSRFGSIPIPIPKVIFGIICHRDYKKYWPCPSLLAMGQL